MKKITTILILYFFIFHFSLAQEPGVGIGTEQPEAILDITAENEGILIPRMTANQIENIQNPHESEWVYALTDDGIIVNEKGFWFFQSGTWVNLQSSSFNNNIFNSNGVLTGNRVVTQAGFNLNFGPQHLFISGNSNAVGLFTDAPTEALDVNGDMEIKVFDQSANVLANQDGVLVLEESYFDIGDVKPSFLTSDHDGWYLLDGRNLNELPPNAQTNAVEILNLTTYLPDASGRYSIGTTSYPGNFTGNNTVELTRSNLPAFNFNYTTNAAGDHSHSVSFERIRVTAQFGDGNNVHAYWLSGPYSAGENYARNTVNASHNHSFTVNSGGNSAPIDIRPTALNANFFVYLGND